MHDTINPTAFYQFDTAENISAEILLPYDFDVIVEGCTFRFGRFSLGLLKRIRMIAPLNRMSGIVFSAGAFVEASPSCEIILGGEHNNSCSINWSAGCFGRIFNRFTSAEGRDLLEPLAKGCRIGDSVVLSTNSVLLDGTDVGTGAVVGAGAVVTGLCERYGIYAGTPARKIRTRIALSRQEQLERMRLPWVRGHHIPKLPEIMASLDQGRLNEDEARSKIDYMSLRPRIIIAGALRQNQIMTGEIIRYEIDGETLRDHTAIEKLNSYFSQAKSPTNKLTWSPDVFHALGLT